MAGTIAKDRLIVIELAPIDGELRLTDLFRLLEGVTQLI
jgi:hypothetical protein